MCEIGLSVELITLAPCFLLLWCRVRSREHAAAKSPTMAWLTLIALFLCPSITSGFGGSSIFGSPVAVPHRARSSASSTKCQRHRHHSHLSMKIKCGVVGLPNVGKSTLFNALAKRSLAESANFPFCTIDPNVAPIAIPDQYLEPLGVLANSRRTVPATIEFVDVAGLVKGASCGEGLGNKFLATIRECDCIVHVVRTFEDGNTIHVDGKVEPLADAEVVNLELLLADLAHVERRLDKSSCQGEEREALEMAMDCLEKGVPARSAGLSQTQAKAIKSMGLLTLKPVIYAFNVDEVDFFLSRDDVLREAKDVVKSLQYSDDTSSLCTIVSAKVEAELSATSHDEQVEYLSSLGVELEDGSDGSIMDMLSYNVLPLQVMELLDLSLCYTGPGVPPERSQTTKAHVFRQAQELTAVGLASKLHGTIEKGFIRAELISAPELLEYPNHVEAKESGKVRVEGKDYTLNPSDVVLIKWRE